MSTIKDLKNFVSSDIQKEIIALEKVYTLFPGMTLAQIVKKFEKYQKDQRTSPDGLAQRITWLRSGQFPETENPETADSILADYAKFTAAKAKTLGKALEINISNPKDAVETAAFANWLNGGSPPPTEQEKIASLVQKYADSLQNLMDSRRNGTISIDQCVSQCKAVVAEVQKQYKAPGLLLLCNAIHVTGNPKDTAAKLAKALNLFFDDRGQKWKRDLDIDPGK